MSGQVFWRHWCACTWMTGCFCMNLFSEMLSYLYVGATSEECLGSLTISDDQKSLLSTLLNVVIIGCFFLSLRGTTPPPPSVPVAWMELISDLCFSGRHVTQSCPMRSIDLIWGWACQHISQDLANRRNSQNGLSNNLPTEVQAEDRKTVRDSAVLGVIGTTQRLQRQD